MAKCKDCGVDHEKEFENAVDKADELLKSLDGESLQFTTQVVCLIAGKFITSIEVEDTTFILDKFQKVLARGLQLRDQRVTDHTATEADPDPVTHH